MNILKYSLLIIVCLAINGCKDKNNTDKSAVGIQEEPLNSEFTIRPIQHATMVLEWNGKTIYVDPVGGKAAFTGEKIPI